MFQNYFCHLVELLLPFRVVVLLEPYQTLDLQLDRSKRVLDLMGHLTRHLTPRLVPFRLSQLLCRFLEVLYHSVVCLYKGIYLIFSFIFNVFEVVDVRVAHLLAHLDQRCKHRIDKAGTDQQRYYQEQYEKVYDQGCMEECFRAEIIVLVRIWDAHDRNHVSPFVE